MKKLISWFLQGLLYLVPISVTLYVLIWSISYADGLINNLEFMKEYSLPGLGLLVIIVLVTIVGYIGTLIITSPLAKVFHQLINSVPLVRIIYSSVKDLMSAFVGKERKFDTPVLVSLDDTSTIHRLGFITSTDLSKLSIKDMVGVYLPSSYGILGELVIVPNDKVKKIDAYSSEVMKFIVSGGITQVSETEESETER